MNNKRYDILGIGNAIVDILGHCEESLLAKEHLPKGSMTLIDEMRADTLYSAIGAATECSGGSAANTLASLASLGAKTAFIGKVRNDQLGKIFRHDLQSIGVSFNTEAAQSGPSTARCLVFVTADGERTMATYLGACSGVSEVDIEEELIAQANMIYIEGYLWDEPHAKSAIRKAIRLAKEAGIKIALTLSDTFCVERHRVEFLQMIEADIDVLFANEAELLALFETEDMQEASLALQEICDLAAVTRSEKGAIVISQKEIITVPTKKVSKVVDTTGAGDLFAGGFLFGLSRGWDYASCAKLANECAAQIIQQIGARAQAPLDRLVA